MTSRTIFAIVAALTLAGAAQAAEHHHAMTMPMAQTAKAAAPNTGRPRLSIVQAWSRPTPPGAPTAAGYLTVVNSGTGPDQLLGGSSPLVGKVEIHEMSMTGGIMRMRPVPEGVPIPAGGRAVFGPGGYHLMLVGPKRPFKAGDKVPLTLRFQRAGAVQVVLNVGMEPGA